MAARQRQQQAAPRVENDECPICLESLAGASAAKTMVRVQCMMA